MKKRDVVQLAITGLRPPYVPWSLGFTLEAREKLVGHFGTSDLDAILDNHILSLGSGTGFFKRLDAIRYQDIFGVVWNRAIDKDIGVVEGLVLPEPTLTGYEFPDPENVIFFDAMEERIAQKGDCFRVFAIGFSLFERAWTMRGMENLMIDFIEHEDFVRELLHTIADFNIKQIKRALTYDIDAVHFGDDWGQQHGLLMGPTIWRKFIKPELARMYAVAREAGKYVTIHSCGDVDELFDDLIEIGLNCFNPFQPEVMDVDNLFRKFRGQLAFHGGLSTQKTLPYGSAEDVRAETQHLLELGADGGYIFAPAHAVEGDVPLRNMLCFLEELQRQPGYASSRSKVKRD